MLPVDAGIALPAQRTIRVIDKVITGFVGIFPPAEGWLPGRFYIAAEKSQGCFPYIVQVEIHRLHHRSAELQITSIDPRDLACLVAVRSIGLGQGGPRDAAREAIFVIDEILEIALSEICDLSVCLEPAKIDREM